MCAYLLRRGSAAYPPRRTPLDFAAQGTRGRKMIARASEHAAPSPVKATTMMMGYVCWCDNTLTRRLPRRLPPHTPRSHTQVGGCCVYARVLRPVFVSLAVVSNAIRESRCAFVQHHHWLRRGRIAHCLLGARRSEGHPTGAYPLRQYPTLNLPSCPLPQLIAPAPTPKVYPPQESGPADVVPSKRSGSVESDLMLLLPLLLLNAAFSYAGSRPKPRLPKRPPCPPQAGKKTLARQFAYQSKAETGKAMRRSNNVKHAAPARRAMASANRGARKGGF